MNNLKYAASFEEKLFGTTCDVEVVSDLVSGKVTATIAMRQILRSIPACRIGIEELEELLAAMKTAVARASLLAAQPVRALDHQLNWSSGVASLIVVHPPKKNPRYVLTIGSFNLEGDLSQMTFQEVANAIERVNALCKSVSEKVGHPLQPKQ
jgi:hypothetical protein